MSGTALRTAAAVAAIAIGLLVSSTGSAAAQTATDAGQGARRPKLALVLSGGGARGAAEIGALKVFEELHIVPDLIVGTSIGSIVGGLYATGWSPEEIEELLKTMDWNRVFSDRVDRRERTFRRKQDDLVVLIQGKVNFDGLKPYLPPGILGGQSMELFMKSLEIRSTGETDFDAFPIPYRAVATNLNTGEPLVFARGSLATAMRASMAIPGLFAPVEYGDVRLSDGGAVANLPVGIARAQGAEAVIAVDISSPLDPFPQKSASFLDSISRMNSLLTVSNRAEDVGRLKPGDVFIQPDLTGLSFLAFDKAAEAVAKGYEAARAKISELKRFSASDEEWAAFRARHRRRSASDLVVSTVRVENTSGLDDRLVRQAINVPVGQPLDLPALENQLLRLNAMNVFGLIRDGLDRTNGRSELVVTTPAKERGLGTLQAGISLAADFRGETNYTVTLVHRLLAMNRLNGEWENIVQFGSVAVLASQFFQPLDTGQRWFVAPLVEARRELQGVWVGGNRVSLYSLQREQARLDFGRVLGNWGQVRVGAYSASNRAALEIGTPVLPDGGEHTGGVEGAFRIDTLNSTVFPTEGTLLTASYDVSLDSFGADTSYHTAFVSAGHAWTMGRNTVQALLQAGSSFDSQTTVFKLFRLGGLGRLSGYAKNQLIGPRMGLARLMYYRQLVKLNVSSLRIRAFAGASLEAGNVYAKGQSVSLNTVRWSGGPFVGALTPIGPVVLGLGFAEGGLTRVHLVIGERF
jgi:NTE family protein